MFFLISLSVELSIVLRGRKMCINFNLPFNNAKTRINYFGRLFSEKDSFFSAVIMQIKEKYALTLINFIIFQIILLLEKWKIEL